jgi:hypothetical protein
LQFTNIQVGLTVKNVLKNAMKASLVAVLAMGVTVVAQPDQAKAATFKFIPPGSSLDGDGARDLEVAVGETRTLKVVLDTSDLVDGEAITSAIFGFAWDATEVGNVGFTFDVPNSGNSITLDNPTLVTLSALNIGPTSMPTLLGTFSYKVLAGLVNDNAATGTDLRFTSVSLGGLGDDVFVGASRGIDLQPKIIPTPALLPGFAAMGLGMLRKKRQAKTAVA